MINALKVLAGPLLGIFVAWLMQFYGQPYPPSFVAGLAACMAYWWVTEAVSIEITGLLPIVALPFSGIYEKGGLMQACAPYADPNVFFFMGGFGLGLAIERAGLHRIGALYLLRLAGTNGVAVVGSFMLATALISMWVNNTATTLLMIPLAMSVVAIQPSRQFAAPLLIGIAYASSIGGMATLVGTAPNIFFTGFLSREGITLDFLGWMFVAGPIAFLLLIGTWVWLTLFLFPVRKMTIEVPQEWKDEIASQKGFTPAQVTALFTFAFAALLWMFKGPITNLFQAAEVHSVVSILQKMENPWIAMAAMVFMLLVPFGKPVLTWKDMESVPWGVLILMGGGLSLAQAIEDSGLDQRIASVANGFDGLPTLLVLTLVVMIVIAVSELASNLATATALIPILAGVGPSLGLDHLTLLTTVVLASSCGFMLPVATPPNTLVYAQKKFPTADMMKAGFVVNLMAVVLIPPLVLLLRPLLG